MTALASDVLPRHSMDSRSETSLAIIRANGPEIVDAMSPQLTEPREVDPATVTRREDILDAATDLFAEFGYSDAVTKDLVEKLQIGKGTIYRHFPSKRDLFLAAVDRVMQRLRTHIDSAIAVVPDPVDRIEEGTRAFLGFFADHPKFVELLILERALFKDRTTPTYSSHLERSKQRWHELYENLISVGRIRRMPVDRITTVFLDLAYGTIFTNYFSNRSRTSEDQAKAILDVVFHGILGEGERQTRVPEPVPPFADGDSPLDIQ